MARIRAARGGIAALVALLAFLSDQAAAAASFKIPLAASKQALIDAYGPGIVYRASVRAGSPAAIVSLVVDSAAPVTTFLCEDETDPEWQPTWAVACDPGENAYDPAESRTARVLEASDSGCSAFGGSASLASAAGVSGDCTFALRYLDGSQAAGLIVNETLRLWQLEGDDDSESGDDSDTPLLAQSSGPPPSQAPTAVAAPPSGVAAATTLAPPPLRKLLRVPPPAPVASASIAPGPSTDAAPPTPAASAAATLPYPRTAFGCVARGSRCGGLSGATLALGGAPTSTLGQLAAGGTVDDALGWCLGEGSDEATAFAVLGKAAPVGATLSSAPLRTVSPDAVGLLAASVADVPVTLPTGGLILEPALASPYLNASQALVDAVRVGLKSALVVRAAVDSAAGRAAASSAGGAPSAVTYLGFPCVRGAGLSASSAAALFPAIQVGIASRDGSAIPLTVPPRSYVSAVEVAEGVAPTYCALVVPEAPPAGPWRLGAPGLRGRFFRLDRARGTLEWGATAADCSSLAFDGTVVETSSPPAPPPPPPSRVSVDAPRAAVGGELTPIALGAGGVS